MFKLEEAGVGGMILKVFQKYLSSCTQRVKVDGVCSFSVGVVSCVPQGSVLGPLLFLLCIADLPGLLKNVLVGYTDDSTLFYKIPHPRDKASVAASLNDDLTMISDCSSKWGMLVNPSKSRRMFISRSCTVVSFSLTWSLMVRLWRWFLSCFCLEEGQRKTVSVFRDVAVKAKCFWAFILPVLEYCSTVWMSVATSHLLLLVRVVGRVSQLSGGSVSCDLWHRRKVASLCVFFKIDSLVGHPVLSLFHAQNVM